MMDPIDVGTTGPVGPRRQRVLFGILVVLLIGAAGMLLFWPRAPRAPQPDATQDDVARPTAAERSLQLYFADADAQGLVAEKRMMRLGGALEDNVEAAVNALVAGPGEHEHASVLPSEARLLQTYYTDATRTLFLDFNSALVTKHPGGSTAEYLTLSALVRTVGANFPEVTRLQILVDGQAIDTLAGHFDISKPIEIAEWH